MNNPNPVTVRPGLILGINSTYADIEFALRNLPRPVQPRKPSAHAIHTTQDARAFVEKMEAYDAEVVKYEAEKQSVRDTAELLQSLWDAKLRREYALLPDAVFVVLYTYAKENTDQLYKLRETVDDLSALSVAICKAYKEG